MLRSPDDPNFLLRSRVPTETHRRRPEVTMKDAYTIGIEEEYFLVDASTKLVTRDMPKTFLAIAKEATNGQVMGEFLQSQCEVASDSHVQHTTAAGQDIDGELILHAARDGNCGLAQATACGRPHPPTQIPRLRSG